MPRQSVDLKGEKGLLSSFVRVTSGFRHVSREYRTVV